MVHCIWLNNKTVSERKKRAGATVGLFYLEPMPVINDRARNPTRHEFCIRLFVCAWFEPAWPEHMASAWKARKKATWQIMWCLLTNCVEYIIILAKKGRGGEADCNIVGSLLVKTSGQHELGWTYPVSVCGKLWRPETEHCGSAANSATTKRSERPETVPKQLTVKTRTQTGRDGGSWKYTSVVCIFHIKEFPSVISAVLISSQTRNN